MAFILFTYGLLIIVSLYLKTDKMVDKKGLSRSMDVKDTSVLSYCANFINKYIDRLNQEDISEWTVKEVVNFLEKGDDDVCFSDYARKYNREMCIILRRKHMKNKYFILASMLMLGACTDFLDEKSTGTMSIDSDLSSIESCTALANAVKTLLADVYLTYAGYPVQGGASYYAISAPKSLEVITSGAYDLYPEYADLRNPANNNKKECIFQVQFATDKTHNDMIPKVLPPKSDISAYSSEYGSLVPTKEFYESFDKADKRARERQFFFSSYPGNSAKLPADSPKLEKVDFGGFYIYKFFDEEAIVHTAKSNLNWTLYRYADLLLMYAEAQVEADGTANNQALEALNRIRRRAELPDFTNPDKGVFRKAVWDERYFELCFEGKIWFDMVRTRKIRNDFDGTYYDFSGYRTVYGKQYTDQFLLFPLPQRELNANSQLTQNKGYA